MCGESRLHGVGLPKSARIGGNESEPEPEIVLYKEDFEEDAGDFVSGGVNNSWEWGEPVTWPSGAAFGDNCWGTNLNGGYNNNEDSYILSPVIDLTGVASGTNLTVEWWQAWYIESAWWDQAYAEYRIDGGNWEVMWQHTGITTQVGWTELSHDISAAGSSIEFRWRLVTDFSVVYSGIYVDEISIKIQ